MVKIIKMMLCWCGMVLSFHKNPWSLPLVCNLVPHGTLEIAYITSTYTIKIGWIEPCFMIGLQHQRLEHGVRVCRPHYSKTFILISWCLKQRSNSCYWREWLEKRSLLFLNHPEKCVLLLNGRFWTSRLFCLVNYFSYLATGCFLETSTCKIFWKIAGLHNIPDQIFTLSDLSWNSEEYLRARFDDLGNLHGLLRTI